MCFLFTQDKIEVIDEALDHLASESLIINENDIIVESSIQEETLQLIEKETKTFILNNIVYYLNHILTDDDISDLRVTHEIRIINLYNHVVKIHKNYWQNTFKSDHSAELVKKLGTIN